MELNRVSRIDKSVEIKKILISTADKSGLDYFVREILAVNPSAVFYSTGGTYAAIRKIIGSDSTENLVSVSDYTGQPEMQGGLVKTLDFRIYLGLLSETYNEAHSVDLARTGASVFDMVVVNLYPFRQTVASEGITVEDARTNIDIGGPCMLRASAKNFLRVASVCDPDDYRKIISELKKNEGRLSFSTRYSLAVKSFTHTAEYDKAISGYLADLDPDDAASVYSFE